MKFYIKERIFSFGDNFDIWDEDGRSAFQVQGQVFSFGNKLHLYDNGGRELVYIEQKLFRFLPEYTIYEGDKVVATVKKRFTLFSHSFDIDSIYGNYELDGDFTGHSFSIYKNGRDFVASLNKKWFSFGDSYEIIIDNDEPVPFSLALVIVIDQVIHDGNKN